MRSDKEKRDSGDYFRALTHVGEPDPRSMGFVRFDEHGERPVTIADRHAALAELNLSNAVPDEVTIQFDTARNLLLHSWYVYRFSPVAELQAYRTVEMALRIRFGFGQNTGPGLSKLLKQAVSQGLVKHEIVADTLPRLRNALAHGGSTLMTPGNSAVTLRLCRDLINQLFA